MLICHIIGVDFDVCKYIGLFIQRDVINAIIILLCGISWMRDLIRKRFYLRALFDASDVPNLLKSFLSALCQLTCA